MRSHSQKVLKQALLSEQRMSFLPTISIVNRFPHSVRQLPQRRLFASSRNGDGVGDDSTSTSNYTTTSTTPSGIQFTRKNESSKAPNIVISNEISTSSESQNVIPNFAVSDSPVWLEMMMDFLRQKPRVVLLDVDSAPLPFLLDPNGESDRGLSTNTIPHSYTIGDFSTTSHNVSIDDHKNRLSRASTSADSRASLNSFVEEDLIVELLGCDNLRYVHIPHPELRQTLQNSNITGTYEDVGFFKTEPLAVIGGTSTQSSQAQTILREEGFKKVCNVHTFKYLRKLLSIKV